MMLVSKQLRRTIEQMAAMRTRPSDSLRSSGRCETHPCEEYIVASPLSPARVDTQVSPPLPLPRSSVDAIRLARETCGACRRRKHDIFALLIVLLRPHTWRTPTPCTFHSAHC